MFVMKQIGRTIAGRRKEKNMTQMELADAMGVSFQAVSNWERGNSMPDISKLPDLAALLGLSIDELLSNDEPSKLVQHIIEGDAEAYIREEKVTADTVAQVAPILKPQLTEDILQDVLDQDAEDTLLDDLSQVAPFVSEDFLHGWAMKIVSIDNVRDLTHIAPFLSEETLDLLVEKLTEESVSIRALSPLAPFLSKKTLDELAQRCVNDANLSDLQSLAPFLSKETLGNLVLGMTESSDVTVKQLVSLAPFLSKEALILLAEKLSGDALSVRAILPLAPFLPKEALDGLARRCASDANLSELVGLAPFVSKEVLAETVLDMADAGTVTIRQISSIAPFLTKNALHILCEKVMHDADPKDVASLAPFLSKETLHACAEQLIAQYGLRGIRDIAPFL